MSVLAVSIVNNHNTPVLIRTRTQLDTDYDGSIDLLFKLHSSLDVVEERHPTNREPFLGVLTQSDSYKIYGLCSATNNKILLMVNHATIRDNDARAILKTIHNIFVDVTTNNPFYVHGQPITSSISVSGRSIAKARTTDVHRAQEGNVVASRCSSGVGGSGGPTTTTRDDILNVRPTTLPPPPPPSSSQHHLPSSGVYGGISHNVVNNNNNIVGGSVLNRRSLANPPATATGIVKRDAQDNPQIDFKVRGILNKITPEKFEKLSQELLDLGLESQNVLKRVLLLIFNKALDDYKYSSLYAKLCKVINDNLSPYYEKTDNKNIFKILLFTKCKEEFENRRKAFELFENQDAPLSLDDEEKRAVAKQKMLGNIKFICELGKQQLLPKNILHECIWQLLCKKKNQSFKDKQEDFECLCEIMKNIGHLLEAKEEARNLLDQYFDRMEMYSNSNEICSRIKFMLLDVIDLRKNNWVPRQRSSLFNPISETSRAESQQHPHHHHGRDNGMFSPYGSLYQMPGHFRQGSGGPPFLSNARADDVFSHVPLGPIYLGTGPGAINDHHFPLNNQRRSNYGSGGGSGGSGGGSGVGSRNFDRDRGDRNYNQQQQQSNMMNKRDGSGNFQQQRQSGQQQGGGYHQGDRDWVGDRGGGYYGGSSSMNGTGQQQRDQQRDPLNLPPRFQKQMKQHAQSSGGGSSAAPFQSFMNKNMNDGGRSGGGLLPQHQKSDKMMPMMNRQQPPFPQQPQQQQKPFNKFMPGPILPGPTGIGNKLNGGKDLTNDFGQKLKLGGNDDSAKSEGEKNGGAKSEAVNVIFEIEKLLLEYYDTEKPDPIINFMKSINKNFEEILVLIMRISIGKAEKERDLTNKLINKMKSDGLVTDGQFLAALRNLFAKISELEVETPRARSHVAAFVANAITENVITLKEIGDLLDGGLHYPLFPLILQNLHKAKGQQWLFEMFSESKINLMNMVPEPDRNKERMADILEDRNLTFLYPMLRIESDITKQITSDCPPQHLYRWLKENVNATLQNSTEFILVVFSTLLKHIISKHNNEEKPNQFGNEHFQEQEKELAKYSQVLQVFLAGKHHLQLVVLYSLQTYAHDLNFPRGLIEKWFNMLYEHEIVDEEVFFKWREDINDEYPGKGKALFQVNKWLTWLEEADEDEEEE